MDNDYTDDRIFNRQWFIHAVDRETGDKSKVGPFCNIATAARYCNKHRPPDKWKFVELSSMVETTRVKECRIPKEQ